jgi:hypothetical protein
VDEGEEAAMTPKSRITVDTKTLQRADVELLLRQHHIAYDLAGTEPSATPVERTGDQSPYQLQLPDRVTEAERAFLNKFAAGQQRSARYLYAHGRESRDVFVTADVACFGEPDSRRRRELSMSSATAIMSLEEFKRWVEQRAN